MFCKVIKARLHDFFPKYHVLGGDWGYDNGYMNNDDKVIQLVLWYTQSSVFHAVPVTGIGQVAFITFFWSHT